MLFLFSAYTFQEGDKGLEIVITAQFDNLGVVLIEERRSIGWAIIPLYVAAQTSTGTMLHYDMVKAILTAGPRTTIAYHACYSTVLDT